MSASTSSSSNNNMDAYAENMMMNSKVYVEHNYTDHSNVPVYRPLDELNNKRRGPRGGVLVPFPEKLYQMLNQIADDGLDDVVSWQPHGRCFVVHQPERFVKEVMPRYFSQTKLTSFQRQVNLYGFRRLTAGNDRNGYYHELFLRGRPDLLKRMTRVRVKGTGCKLAPSPATEPNFYRLPYCHEKVGVMFQGMDMDLDTLTHRVTSSLGLSRASNPDGSILSLGNQQGATTQTPCAKAFLKKTGSSSVAQNGAQKDFKTINSFLKRQVMMSSSSEVLQDNNNSMTTLQSSMPAPRPDTMGSFQFGTNGQPLPPQASMDLTPLPPCSSRNYLLEMRDDILQVLASSQCLWAADHHDDHNQAYHAPFPNVPFPNYGNESDMTMMLMNSNEEPSNNNNSVSQSLKWSQQMFEI